MLCWCYMLVLYTLRRQSSEHLQSTYIRNAFLKHACLRAYIDANMACKAQRYILAIWQLGIEAARPSTMQESLSGTFSLFLPSTMSTSHTPEVRKLPTDTQQHMRSTCGLLCAVLKRSSVGWLASCRKREGLSTEGGSAASCWS